MQVSAGNASFISRSLIVLWNEANPLILSFMAWETDEWTE